MLKSPLLDGETEGTLSLEEAELLTAQVLSAPGEREAVVRFLGLVRRSAGSQRRVDELMAAAESHQSADLIVAHRAALVGRLSDIGLVDHTGRGDTARIVLTQRGLHLLKSINLRNQEANDV
jgi:hypothetical protein